ncbi:GNAT family N-acetyltransferase [Gramella sp. MAR_2010_147]|uniref:GNAT family N-acetyltransferase n=1 Tax=Gramella sp. MAR_2010_147 TaxID=1250205 RepID=UPI0008799598|nr:GNAT family N-acetyltransferase [Gramella sp. MAR_2010_147]SDS37263.1 ElaA protein [Gramella sp. MAR_2010_147]
MNLRIEVKKFNELNLVELYSILQLRSEVFVVEQNCVYQDIDGKDDKALHIIGFKNDKIVAYTRCFQPGFYFNEAAIGRVVVKDSERKFGYGHDIMKASDKAILDFYKTSNIKLSAQQYLIKFYKTHGYQTTGDGYLEDGIPHIAMVKD